MNIIPSKTLRNDYASVSAAAHASGEPILVTKNGEGDLVVMSQEAYDRRERMLDERAKVLEAEAHRIAGARTFSVDECRDMLRSPLREIAL